MQLLSEAHLTIDGRADIIARMPISRGRTLFTTALGHLTVDLYSALVPILLAQLSRAFHLSNAQIGLAVLSYTATSALSQPVFGLLADRIGGRVLATVGVLWCGSWLAVAGFAPSYYPLVAALMLAGLGSGAYHPQGVVRASVASAGQRGAATSIFFLGGSVGMAFGPFLGGQMLPAWGPHSLGLASLLALPVAWQIWRVFADTRHHTTAADLAAGKAGAPKPRPGMDWTLLPMWIAGALLVAQGARAWVSDSSNAYVPKFYLDQGLPPAQYGLIASVFLIGSSVGGLIGGYLSDRVNKKLVMSGALLLAAPSLYLFFHSPPETRLLFGFLAGLCLAAPFTPTLMILQGLMPERLSTITGLAMTYFFLAGGIGTSMTGVLADRFGLVQTMNISTGILVFGALVSLVVPARHTVTAALRPQLQRTGSGGK
jgi:MFS transporter, FSR family, fosmidomycin resistance protein